MLDRSSLPSQYTPSVSTLNTVFDILRLLSNLRGFLYFDMIPSTKKWWSLRSDRQLSQKGPDTPLNRKLQVFQSRHWSKSYRFPLSRYFILINWSVSTWPANTLFQYHGKDNGDAANSIAKVLGFKVSICSILWEISISSYYNLGYVIALT